MYISGYHKCECMTLCMHACMNVCMYVCKYQCMYVCMSVCMHVHGHMCILVYGNSVSERSRQRQRSGCACIVEHVHLSLCLHAYARPTYLPACLPPCLPTYLPTYLPTCLPTYLPTHIHTYIHICIHTCIHAYIHTYTFVNSYRDNISHTTLLCSRDRGHALAKKALDDDLQLWQWLLRQSLKDCVWMAFWQSCTSRLSLSELYDGVALLADQRSLTDYCLLVARHWFVNSRLRTGADSIHSQIL